MKVSVVIPTLNERQGIGVTIDNLKKAMVTGNSILFSSSPLDWEVIVVDGKSHDGTAELAEGLGARVVREHRRGYGRAFKSGFEVADGDFVATLDGDASYPASCIPNMIEHLLRNRLDFIVGDRLRSRTRAAMPTMNFLGNMVLGGATRLLFPHESSGIRTFPDIESGMWVFRRSILANLELTSDGTEFSQEIKLEAMCRGFQYRHLDIPYEARVGESKLHPFRDGGLDILWLVKRRLERRNRRHEVAGSTAERADMISLSSEPMSIPPTRSD